MSSLNMFESGEYAVVLAYMTEHIVDIDSFDASGVPVLPGVAMLDLMVGEEVEVLYKHDGELAAFAVY